MKKLKITLRKKNKDLQLYREVFLILFTFEFPLLVLLALVLEKLVQNSWGLSLSAPFLTIYIPGRILTLIATVYFNKRKRKQTASNHPSSP